MTFGAGSILNLAGIEFGPPKVSVAMGDYRRAVEEHMAYAAFAAAAKVGRVTSPVDRPVAERRKRKMNPVATMAILLAFVAGISIWPIRSDILDGKAFVFILFAMLLILFAVAVGIRLDTDRHRRERQRVARERHLLIAEREWLERERRLHTDRVQEWRQQQDPERLNEDAEDPDLVGNDPYPDTIKERGRER